MNSYMRIMALVGIGVQIESFHQTLRDMDLEHLRKLIVLNADEKLVEVNELGWADSRFQIGSNDFAGCHADTQLVFDGKSIELILEHERLAAMIEHDQLEINRLNGKIEQLANLALVWRSCSMWRSCTRSYRALRHRIG